MRALCLFSLRLDESLCFDKGKMNRALQSVPNSYQQTAKLAGDSRVPSEDLVRAGQPTCH